MFCLNNSSSKLKYCQQVDGFHSLMCYFASRFRTFISQANSNHTPINITPA